MAIPYDFCAIHNPYFSFGVQQIYLNHLLNYTVYPLTLHFTYKN
ncbi:hypothetical protein VCHA43P277_30133 [Vibrio chagasii]|nr:hypothetical protein VCHA43P277_30133 [Vibrio chagasii]